MSLNLNQNHWAALVFTIIAWVTGWYALVLITATNRSTDTNGNTIDGTKFTFIDAPANIATHFYNIIKMLN